MSRLMPNLSTVVLSLILIASFIADVYSHGYIESPRARNYIAWEEGVWSGGTSATYPKEDCPQCANIGGTAGQCGVIGGRNYDKNLNVFGKPMPADPQARYARGQVITVDVILTAHHKGHFEFSACPVQQGGVATAACFNKYRLKFVSDPLYGAPKDPNYPYRAYIAPPGVARKRSAGLLYRFRLKLPNDLAGNLVLLQWHYFTANSCIYSGYRNYPFPSKWGNTLTGLGTCGNIPSGGGGLPEQFWNCAEISVSGSPVTPTSQASAPVPAPSKPASTPVSSQGTCGNGKVGNGVCPNKSLCCSKWGYCGTSASYCGSRRDAVRSLASKPQSDQRSLSTGTCGGGSVGNGKCPNSSLCCSKWGYCGSGSLYCTGSSKPCGGGLIGSGKCSNPSLCCSQYGYCGTGSTYCGVTSASKGSPTRKPTKRPTPSPVKVNVQDGSRGTCGGGNVGNGKCPNSGLCCSQWGYCGTGSSFCSDSVAPKPSPTTTSKTIPFPSYADGNCAGVNNVMRVNVGYYQSWAIYRQNGCNPVSPGDIDVSGNGYTHLIYTFASINSNFQLEPWGGDYTTEVSQFRAFTNLKKTNTNLKTLIAVGGWTFNDPGATLTRFSDTASTAARRATFAKSCVDFCRTYNFDGIDLDWEYPGDTSRGGDSADKTNFVLLVNAIRSAFDDADLGLQLTMAIPVADFRLEAGYNLPALSGGVNFFNLMTYDIYGTWDSPKVVGANTDMPYIFDAIKYILNSGVSPSKLVLGLAAYGRTYNMADSSCTAAGCFFSSGGVGGCAGETGFMPYFTIDQYVKSGNYKSLRFNGNTGTMELVINGNVLISYDSPATLGIKYDFASKACLRGLMWWAVDMMKNPIVLD